MTWLPFKTKRNILAVIVIVALVSVGAWISKRAWESLCGNHRIDLYGCIVDEKNQAIPGVRVDVTIFYSDLPSLPMMYGRVERRRTFSVATDENGYFQVIGIVGYGVSLRGFRSGAGC